MHRQIQAKYSWVNAGASGLHGTEHRGQRESTKVSEAGPDKASELSMGYVQY